MSLYKRGEIWWIYLTHEGKRIRESAETSDRRAAQRFHDERKAELWAEARQAGDEPTWIDACTRWLNAAQRSQSEAYSMRALNETYFDRPLSQCTRESFELALADKSPGTFNRYRAMIQAVLHLSGVDIKIPMKKGKRQRLRFLSEEEWQRLHAELPTFLRTLATFALATGLRQHNVTHLTWQQLDLQRRVAWIHADEAKGGAPIGIPLSDQAVAILAGQRGKHDEWVFPYVGRGRSTDDERFKGRPIGKIKTAWQLAMERAGLGYFERELDADGSLLSKRWIGDFTWHGLRHTWAAWHVMSGTPLNVLQKLGGWADIEMVQIYAHLAPEYLANYANNARPWNAQAALVPGRVAGGGRHPSPAQSATSAAAIESAA